MSKDKLVASAVDAISGKGARRGKGIPLQHTVRHLDFDDLVEVASKLLEELRKIKKNVNYDELFSALYKGRHLKFIKPKYINKIIKPKNILKTFDINVDRFTDFDKARKVYRETLQSVDLIPDSGVVTKRPPSTIWLSEAGEIFHEVEITPSLGKRIRKATRSEDVVRDAAGEFGQKSVKKKHRCHSIGPGFGLDSPFGVFFCSSHVNLNLQNNGIEFFLREMAASLPDGKTLQVVTRTTPRVGGASLKEITYKVSIFDSKTDKASELFQYAIGMHDNKGKIFDGVLSPHKSSSFLKQFNKEMLLRQSKMDEPNEWLIRLINKLGDS